MVKVTIPGYICSISEEKTELERLLFRFGRAHRRAYSLKQKGYTKSEIERILQEGTGLNSRYIKDAYHSVKDLPPHVTFGGLKNQRLREKGKISKEEYHRRRNSIVISRGDKSKGGNLNMRLDLGRMELRISTGEDRRWIYPKIYIPKKHLEKYGHLLNGSAPYTIVIKRRNHDKGYDVRITVEVLAEPKEGKRVMALDMNAGHIDFAVMDKESFEVVSVGRVEVHETQYVKRGKREYRIHEAVDKIGNIAEHYDADVVVGKLSTGDFKSGSKKANRKVKNMPQHKFRQALKKLEISPLVGLDVHKCSAIAFCVKVMSSDRLKELMTLLLGVPSNEGDGSLRGRAKGRKRANCPRPGLSRMRFWAAMTARGGYPAMPGSRGLSFVDSLRAGLPCLRVKVC